MLSTYGNYVITNKIEFKRKAFSLGKGIIHYYEYFKKSYNNDLGYNATTVIQRILIHKNLNIESYRIIKSHKTILYFANLVMKKRNNENESIKPTVKT